MDIDSLEASLDAVRPGLQADGFDLRVAEIRSETEVEVELSAGPEACHDCLVPDALLVQIIEHALRANEPQLEAVILRKSGFDN